MMAGFFTRRGSVSFIQLSGISGFISRTFVFVLLTSSLMTCFINNVNGQAANNTCATATVLTVNGNCSSINGDLYLANTTNPTGGCGSRADVWYRFTVPANSTFVTITVNLTSNPSSLTNTNTFIELFNTSNCASINGNSIGGCNTISSPRTYTGLTPGATYYFRVYTNLTPNTNPSRWGFNICVSSNDNCATATTITPGSTVNNGILLGASASTGIPVGCATGTPDDDVWYQFTAVANHAIVTLSGVGTNLSSSGAMIQLFSGSCGSLVSIACGRGIINHLGGLIPGDTYYIRVYSAGAGQTGYSAAGGSFRISVTPSAPVVVSSGRMKEMYHQTILSAPNTIDNPWEVTHGPDNKLWITESKGYRLFRMDPVTGARDTLLDISQGSTFLPVPQQTFNMQFNIGTNNPQGGFAGLALHPKLLDPVSPQNFVYISYVHTYISNTDPNGIFYTNRLVRFTYNTGTGKLESPVALCDTLPGSNDHNSQRLIIVPVGSTPYLFYASGDLGAGQFSNRMRPMRAQLPESYEGKILRFNLVPDGDAGALDQWIPNDNPFNATLGVQSAVWATGIRNNQGFAYDSVLNILYGSSHGPYSDDELNIIEAGKNYGHPFVIGYAADNNYNGSTAGAPLPTAGGVSTCPAITNEAGNAVAIGTSYKDPLYSAYAASQAVVNNIWNTNPSNSGWPSEGWAGLDLYTHSLVPGWKKSLIATSLKWGRLVRLKLDPAGTAIVPTGGQDTVSYFGSTNRFRDLALAPDGKDMYVIMDRSATTSGPSANNPVVPGCPGCVQKYSFLGYSDAGGKSSIPTSIDVSPGIANNCINGTTVTINSANSNFWVPITGPDGNILAEIYANGQALGDITTSFYTHGGPIRTRGTARYLNRNITITPQNQPSGTVKIRLYFTKAEYDSLDADPLSLVNTISDVKILKNNDPCVATIASSTTLINPAFAEAHGTGGYMLQADISSFSSFYFGTANIIMPLTLVNFSGTYRSNATYLKWETENEVNTDYFVVERSFGNNDFEPIGKVTAKGRSIEKTAYTLVDPKASLRGTGIVYYRLKMFDKDGSFTYSSVVAISIPDIMITSVSLYPNPAGKEVILSVNSFTDQKLSWQLIDNTGRVLRRKDVIVTKGANNIIINLEQLPAGSYFLKVNGPFVNSIQKLQKQ